MKEYSAGHCKAIIEVRNNGNFIVDKKQMRAEDGKQKIYLEWPNTVT